MNKLISKFAVVLLTVSMFMNCTGTNQKSTEEGQKVSAMEKNLLSYRATTNIENPSVYLRLVDKQITDSSAVFITKAMDEQDTIGLKIEVIDGISAGIYEDGTVNEDKGFMKGAIKISSLGVLSDNYVKALGKLYDMPTQEPMTTEVLLPLVFSSNKKNVDLRSNETYTFKVFLENKVADEAEAFVTLDLYNRRFELRAKDASFYPALISSFTGK